MPTLWQWCTSRSTAATVNRFAAAFGNDPLGKISSHSRNGWLEVTSRDLHS